MPLEPFERLSDLLRSSLAFVDSVDRFRRNPRESMLHPSDIRRDPLLAMIGLRERIERIEPAFEIVLLELEREAERD